MLPEKEPDSARARYAKAYDRMIQMNRESRHDDDMASFGNVFWAANGNVADKDEQGRLEKPFPVDVTKTPERNLLSVPGSTSYSGADDLQRRLETALAAKQLVEGNLLVLSTAKNSSDHRLQEAQLLLTAQTPRLDFLNLQNTNLRGQLEHHIAVHSAENARKDQQIRDLQTQLADSVVAKADLETFAALDGGRKDQLICELRDELRQSIASLAGRDDALETMRGRLAAACSDGAVANSLQAALDEAHGTIAAANRTLELMGTQLAAARNDAAVTKKAEQTAQERIAHLEVEVRGLADVCHNLQVAKEASQEAAERRIAELRGEMQSLVEEGRGVKAQLAIEMGLRPLLTAAEDKGLKAANDATSLRIQLTELVRENAAKSKEIAALNDENQMKTMETGALRTENVEQTKEIAALRVDSVEKAKEIAALSDENVKKAKEIGALYGQNADKTNEIDALRAESVEKTKEIAALHGQNVEKTKQIAALHGQNVEKTKELAALHGQCRHDKEEIEELGLRLKAQERQLVEELGRIQEQMTDIVTTGAAARAAASQTMLEMEAQARSDSATIASMKQQLATVALLTGAAAEAQRAVAEMEVQASANQAEFSRIKRQLVDASAALAQASDQARASATEATHLRADNARLVAAVEGVEGRLRTLQGEADELGKAVAARDARVSELEAADAKRQGEMEKLVKQAGDTAADRVKLFAAGKKSKDEAAAVRAERDLLDAQVRSLQEALRVGAEQAEKWQRQWEKAQGELTELVRVGGGKDVRVAELEGVLKASDAAAGKLRTTLSECESMGEGLGRQLGVATHRVADAEGQCARAREEGDRLKAALAAAEEQVGRGEEELRRVRAQCAEVAAAKAAVESAAAGEAQGAHEEVRRLQRQLVEVASDRDALEVAAAAGGAQRAGEREAADRLKKQAADLATTLAEAEGEEAALRGQGKKDAAELVALRARVHDLSQALEVAEQGALEGLRRDAQARSLADELAALQREAGVLATAKAAAEQEVERLKAAGKKGAVEAAGLEEQLALSSRRYDSQISRLADELSVLQSKYDEVAATRAQGDLELVRVKSSAKKDAAEVAGLQDRVAALESQAKRDQAEVAALRQQGRAAADAATDSLTAVETAHHEELTVLRRRLSEAEGEVSALRGDAAARATRTAELEEKVRRGREEVERLRGLQGQWEAQSASLAAAAKRGKEEAEEGAREGAALRAQVAEAEAALAAKDAVLAKMRQRELVHASEMGDLERRLVEGERRGEEDAETVASLRQQLVAAAAEAAEAGAEAQAQAQHLQREVDDAVRQGQQDAVAVDTLRGDLETLSRAKADLERTLLAEREKAGDLWRECVGLKGRLDEAGLALVVAERQAADREAALKMLRDEASSQTALVGQLTSASAVAER